MSRRSGWQAWLVALGMVLGTGGATSASDQGFLDVDLRVRPVHDGLAEELRALEAGPDRQWVAWIAPALEPDTWMCCFDYRNDRTYPQVCHLESGNHGSGKTDDGPRAGGDLRVMLRLDDGEVDRVQVFSEGCQIDADGSRVTLLTDVEPRESVAVLERIVQDDRGRRRSDGAMMAIAHHAGSAADEAMVRFARTGSPDRVRERAAFWLGASRGAAGLDELRRMLRREQDDDVLEQVVFGISISEAAGAESLLLDLARNDKRSEIRKRALFWVAQKAGERAVDTLDAAVHDDPDAEVREHAVFALSQLDDGRGIPILIRLARDNPHPEVRKRAMFWLGQSGDPRALELFEEILGR